MLSSKSFADFLTEKGRGYVVTFSSPTHSDSQFLCGHHFLWQINEWKKLKRNQVSDKINGTQLIFHIRVNFKNWVSGNSFQTWSIFTLTFRKYFLVLTFSVTFFLFWHFHLFIYSQSIQKYSYSRRETKSL